MQTIDARSVRLIGRLIQPVRHGPSTMHEPGGLPPVPVTWCPLYGRHEEGPP